jgi:hypothetical protein
MPPGHPSRVEEILDCGGFAGVSSPLWFPVSAWEHWTTSPLYDFNDEALSYGASYWARLAERVLAKRPGAPEGML